MYSRFYTFFVLLLLNFTLSAQAPLPSNISQRIALDDALAPFYHGVASGDPTQNSVIIWTRLTTDQISPQIEWKVATDTLMQNVVKSGTTTTSIDKDYTVKVDVTGLQPNTFYFYEFSYTQKYSLRGRTKTLPTGNIDKLRFAVVSCSSFPHGYFNVYQAINQRNDVDAIIHLGDYIYEYGKNEYGSIRVPEPTNEILNLADYRLRHNMYKLDSMLMRLHQQYPFYTIWDDHEFADNSYTDGAENHTPTTEGLWKTRKSAALEAYAEWMPIRSVDTTNNQVKIYRKYNIGNLVDLFFLDTRITARKEQTALASLTGTDDSTHYLLGPEQFDWLKTGLQQSTATWKVIGQQVMMAPFKVFNIAFNDDQWDGYPSERKKFFNMINDNNINNLVVLTGDIHSAWASDLPFGNTPYIPRTGEGSAGVEFVTTAVTSPGIPLTGILGNITRDAFGQLVTDNNLHVKHNNFVNRGFYIIDFTPQKAQTDFYNIETIERPNNAYSYQVSYYTEKDSNHLKKSILPTQFNGLLPIKAPQYTRQNITTGIKNKISNFEITGVYPNPFVNYTGIQYYLYENATISVNIYNTNGLLVFQKELGNKSRGFYFEKFDLSNLSTGEYILSINTSDESISRKLIKTE